MIKSGHRKMRIVILVFILLFQVASLSAQTIVHGTVTDENRITLPGAIHDSRLVLKTTKRNIA